MKVKILPKNKLNPDLLWSNSIIKGLTNPYINNILLIMKIFYKKKTQVFIGLCLGCIFGICLGFVLGGIIGIPTFGIITGMSAGAIGGNLMAMFA